MSVCVIFNPQPDEVPQDSQLAGCIQVRITNVACFLLLSFLRILLGGVTNFFGHVPERCIPVARRRVFTCFHSSYDEDISTFITRSAFRMNDNFMLRDHHLMMKWPNTSSVMDFSVLLCGSSVVTLKCIC